MKGGLSIGELAERTGCNVQTIRYYETIGLLMPPPRTEGGQRRFEPESVDRLSFVRHARELGFEIGAIRQLLAMKGEPDRPCEAVDRIAAAQLAAVEARISKLRRLRKELKRMLENCRQGRIADCKVVECLSDHG